MKPAFRSARARGDIQHALDFYILQAPHMAMAFVAALEKSTAQIERQPGIGSPRYALELGIPRLRNWLLNRFPYALFYIEHDNRLDVIRVVHTSRDIPASLQTETLS